MDRKTLRNSMIFDMDIEDIEIVVEDIVPPDDDEKH